MSRYCFLTFELDEVTRTLTQEGATLPLQPKAFDLLLLLLDSPGRVFSREELFARLWPNTVVSDAALTQSVAQVRRALGPEGKDVIRTHSRKGYAIIVPVRRIYFEGPESELIPVEKNRSPVIPSIETRAIRALIAFVLVAALGGVFWNLQEPSAETGKAVVVRVDLEPTLEFQDQTWAGEVLAALLRVDSAGSRRFELTEQHALTRAESAEEVRLSGIYRLKAAQTGTQLTVDWSLTGAAGGRVNWSDTQPVENLLDMVAELEAQLDRYLPGSQAKPRGTSPSLSEASVMAFADGRRARSDGQYGKARDALARAVKLAPHFALARTELAELLWLMGQRDLAISHARAGVELAAEEDAIGQRLTRSTLLAIMRDFRAAAEDMRVLVALHPEKYEWRLRLASYLISAGEIPGAMEVLGEIDVRALAPFGQAQWHQQQALAQAGAERLSEAMESAGKALAIATSHGLASKAAEAHLLLAWFYQRQRKMELASEHATKAAQGFASGDDVAQYFNAEQMRLGLALVRGEAVAEAEINALEDLAARSANAWFTGYALMVRGNWLMARHEMEQANQVWRRAVDLFSEIGERRGMQASTLTLAHLLRQQQRFDEARALTDPFMKEGVVLLVDRWTLLRAQAQDFWAQGDLQAAVRLLDDALLLPGMESGGNSAGVLCQRADLQLWLGEAAAAHSDVARCLERADELPTKEAADLKHYAALLGITILASQSRVGELASSDPEYALPATAPALETSSEMQGRVALYAASHLPTQTAEDWVQLAIQQPAVRARSRDLLASDIAECHLRLRQRRHADAVIACERAKAIDNGQVSPLSHWLELLEILLDDADAATAAAWTQEVHALEAPFLLGLAERLREEIAPRSDPDTRTSLHYSHFQNRGAKSHLSRTQSP
ncbi:MAG: winged helix-turn-helix domain-containing protein [Aquimonas sp.]|nr:winged helix-turn-helix domain-containing protein [Aquimonas sp.]